MCKNIYILGGGASGMFAAIHAALSAMEADNNINISIIEANDKPGKKILATGNGHCNITNTDNEINDKYHCEDKNFTDSILNNFTNKDTINTFKKLGIVLTERNGYLYPNSMQATTVTDTLISYCNLLKIKLITNTVVNDISFDSASGIYRISSYSVNDSKQHKSFFGDKVLISCGTKAGIKQDYSHNIINSVIRFGHTIENYLPALCSVYIDKTYKEFFKTSLGVRTNVCVSLSIDDTIREIHSGELQITEYGLSGIVVFQLSSSVSKALNNNFKTNIIIDFLPVYTVEKIYDIISVQLYFNKKSLLDILSQILNRKLAVALINLYSSLNENDIKAYNKSLSKERLFDIFNFIKNVSFPVIKTNDYLHAQVCCGGINVNEINCNTMESKIVKGLFFSGECINTDGICGGYNLQWAWSTGYIAGRSIVND